MHRRRSKLQLVLYPVFMVSCATAAAIGLVIIWGGQPGTFVLRVLGTSIVVALATAFTMSATRLVAGRAPEDDAG